MRPGTRHSTPLQGMHGAVGSCRTEGRSSACALLPAAHLLDRGKHLLLLQVWQETWRAVVGQHARAQIMVDGNGAALQAPIQAAADRDLHAAAEKVWMPAKEAQGEVPPYS